MLKNAAQKRNRACERAPCSRKGDGATTGNRSEGRSLGRRGWRGWRDERTETGYHLNISRFFCRFQNKNTPAGIFEFR